jgi:hypothetical protein
MTTLALFWCERCQKAIEPTSHEVTEVFEFWGEIVQEPRLELRCDCGEVVVEELACTACKEVRPEPGCDQCAACIAVIETPVLNNTGAYLRIHADWEHESDAMTVPVHAIVNAAFDNVSFGPYATVEQIGRACERFSTNTHEVVAHISWISGKPVVALRKELRPAGLEAMLRPGANVPLFLRRQAS